MPVNEFENLKFFSFEILSKINMCKCDLSANCIFLLATILRMIVNKFSKAGYQSKFKANKGDALLF